MINTGTSRMMPTTAPLAEILLADHQLEDVGREHVEIAADHLGDAEIADRVVNTTIAALIRPYLAAGSVMVKNLRAVRVPIESAASYRRPSVSEAR